MFARLGRARPAPDTEVISLTAPGLAVTGASHPHELVLLHGQPGSAGDWQLVTARLPAQLRVVVADRPGYGSNPRSVLVLADPADRLVPVTTARRLATALPDARLQLVEGAGHHLPRRAPGAVADAIEAFMLATDFAGRLS